MNSNPFQIGCLGVFIICLAGLLARLSPENIALGINWGLNLNFTFVFMSLFWPLAEACFTSVERVLQYSDLPKDGYHAGVDGPEDGGVEMAQLGPSSTKNSAPSEKNKHFNLFLGGERRPLLADEVDVVQPKNAMIPSSDSNLLARLTDVPVAHALSLKNLTLKYRKNLPAALENINLTLAPAERCAVVGRTGAGKSSLAVAVFQLGEEVTGEIRLNGVDLTKLPVDQARKRIGIITQDPFVFGDTVRYNLDPFDDFSDEQCLEALRVAQLLEEGDNCGASATGSSAVVEQRAATLTPAKKKKCSKKNQPQQWTLDLQLEPEGANLSVGERQLLCLARVVLREPELLICDEATASVDLDTDRKVQQAIRDWLSGRSCCVLTIAHRLETIADYDSVLVLAKGRVLEHGKLQDLVADETSEFHDMVKGGGAESMKLFGIGGGAEE